MGSERRLSEKQLEILHDHYKETFALIRSAEVSRDRLFLVVIGLFSLLSLEIGYPAELGGALKKVSLFGGEFDFSALPLAALLNATWVATLAITLRYCQSAVSINRQYPYLHDLERAISPAVGGGDLYHREGTVYLRGYPLLLDVAWIAYGIVFPVMAMVTSVALLWWEIAQLSYATAHKSFDALLAACLMFVFYAYRVHPTLCPKLKRWRKRRAVKARRRRRATLVRNADQGTPEV